jgi:hypothetical protein
MSLLVSEALELINDEIARLREAARNLRSLTGSRRRLARTSNRLHAGPPDVAVINRQWRARSLATRKKISASLRAHYAGQRELA